MPDHRALPEIRFEDVLRLSDKGMLEVLRVVENEELAEALRGAPAGVADKFNRCMSWRAALLIREHTLSRETAALPEARIAERRRSIAEQVRRLLEANTIALENPAGIIDPDRLEGPGMLDSLLADFLSILEWDANKLLADGKHSFLDRKRWATALYGLPAMAQGAFLAKLPRDLSRDLRRSLVELEAPRPEDVELARQYIAAGLKPAPPFTVEMAREIFGDETVWKTLPKPVVASLLRQHRDIVREAMGDECLCKAETAFAPAGNRWWLAVKRFLKTGR